MTFGPSGLGLRLLRALLATLVAVCVVQGAARADDAAATFGALGDEATSALLHVWYDAGKWRLCSYEGCPERNQDWGADALTYTLALRWDVTHDPQIGAALRRLIATAPRYSAPCTKPGCAQWSDVPEWDALAALREYAATGHDRTALQRAVAAFTVVEASTAYARGACPSILYQEPFGGTNQLKTLETDSNEIRAAVLLARATGERAYLAVAIARYRAVRRFFFDRAAGLYTVYVFDDGRTCRQLRHRFFASVNGNMIAAGLELYHATGNRDYLRQAVSTGRAVDNELSDGLGVYANLQAENDVAEPLVEAMDDLAVREHRTFARRWLLRNARAAAATRTAGGSYGRFFDGPVPTGAVTAWQTNGGFALAIAAAALAPDRSPDTSPWRGARYVADDVAQLPATIRFRGNAIALIGTIGEHCCESGHAVVSVDGHDLFDRSGIWQNKSCSGAPLARGVLFAWRFRRRGPHVLRIEVPASNAKEGGAYLHLTGLLVM